MGSKQEMGSRRQTGYRCRVAGVVLLLLGSIAALIAVSVIQGTWGNKEYSMEYGIVIDSGSSRSNVYLYTWPGDKTNETGVVKEVQNCRVAGDGISEMNVDPVKDEASWKAFKECIDNISKIVPPEKHNNTPLFLGATAGMRLLQEQDEQRSTAILANLTSYLSSLPFNFQNASIISGQEEGLYGWVTVNYLMGNFFKKDLWHKYIHPEGGKTVGSMDLGGASTQIAFAVQDNLTGPDYLHIKLYGYPYTIYTHSFLCYGKNEAEKMILDKIVQESPDPDNILNVCLPEGYNFTLLASSIYETQCTKKPKNYNPDQKYFMIGAPNSDKCREIVRSIFDFQTCHSSQCSFNGVEQPPVTGDFMAYAGFFFTSRALLMNGSSDIFDFKSSVETFCHTHWSVLKKEKSWISDKYLKTYCYSAHYVFTLLADGYKFDNETWKNINFTKEVGSTNIGWSLGYMLTLSNMIPSEVTILPPLTNPAFAGLVFLFSALVIVTFVLVFIVIIRTCY